MDRSQYLEIFIEETNEHLQSLNQALLKLESDPGDSQVINEIFRSAHTLKGMSGAMNFTRMSKLTHDMEDVLQAIRNNKLKADAKLVDLLFKCLDALENYCNTIAETGNEGTESYPELIEALLLSLQKNGTEAGSTSNEETKPNNTIKLDQYDINVINRAFEEGQNVFQVDVSISAGCMLKAARAFIVFKTFEKYSVVIKSNPSVEDIEDEKFDQQFTVVIITKETGKRIAEEVKSVSEIEEVAVMEITPGIINAISDGGNTTEAGADRTASNGAMPAARGVDSDSRTGQAAAAGAASSTSPVLSEGIKSINAVSGNKTNGGSINAVNSHNTGNGNSPAASIPRPAKTTKTVRVDIEKLDVLLNLVSELIIQKTRLEGLDGLEKNRQYEEAIESLEKITSNLHDAVMKVRMVPLDTVFNRFPRMIRDISRDLGKEVAFSMSGEDTELDRTVIDEIGDPLIHLLRNAVDHGIETAARRKEIGKPEVGNIWLRAFQDGNSVCIEVEEDGKGIDVDKVRDKAVEKGVLSMDEASLLSKKDIMDLLFRPSFSTADKITDLSGRGVGLDVVKTKIESLGGTVEVESVPGNGTKFIIRLPLTLAIIQALLVIVGNEKYAIQLSTIQQIINVLPDEIKLAEKQEVILFRNTVIPLLRLDEILGVEKRYKEQKVLKVVVVKKGEKLTGFVVDQIIGKHEIVQKPLGKYLSGVKLITSATILGDGNVALILDTSSLTK